MQFQQTIITIVCDLVYTNIPIGLSHRMSCTGRTGEQEEARGDRRDLEKLILVNIRNMSINHQVHTSSENNKNLKWTTGSKNWIRILLIIELHFSFIHIS